MSNVLIITVETYDDSFDRETARNSEIYASGVALKKFRENETENSDDKESGSKKEHGDRKDSKKKQKKYASVIHISLPRRDDKGNKITESVADAIKAYREQLKGKKFCRIEIIGHGDSNGLLGPGKPGSKDENIGDSNDPFAKFIADFYDGPSADDLNGGAGGGSGGGGSEESEAEEDGDATEDNNIIVWACDCGDTDFGATIATIADTNVVTFDGIVNFWQYEPSNDPEENEKNRENGEPITPPEPDENADPVVNTPTPDEL